MMHKRFERSILRILLWISEKSRSDNRTACLSMKKKVMEVISDKSKVMGGDSNAACFESLNT